MLEDHERDTLHTLMSELNDEDFVLPEDESDEPAKRVRAALGKLLRLEAWLSSAQFRTALAATIKGSAHAVLDQRRMYGVQSTYVLWDAISKEIGNNAAQTMLMLLEEPPTGDGT